MGRCESTAYSIHCHYVYVDLGFRHIDALGKDVAVVRSSHRAVFQYRQTVCGIFDVEIEVIHQEAILEIPVHV
ncbi:hypothetical protein DSECCO2_614480 [anaerobic digester metagenome]